MRPLEREDALVLTPWLNDPDVRVNLAHYIPMSYGEEVEYLSKPRQSEIDLVLGIALKADDKLVGSAGLHRISGKNRSAVFGILIGDKQEWGKGYGTEATWLMAKHGFESVNLHRIELHVREGNERGIRAYERVGYKREGLLREDTFVEGRYQSTIVMSILREEWDAKRGGK